MQLAQHFHFVLSIYSNSVLQNAFDQRPRSRSLSLVQTPPQISPSYEAVLVSRFRYSKTSSSQRRIYENVWFIVASPESVARGGMKLHENNLRVKHRNVTKITCNKQLENTQYTIDRQPHKVGLCQMFMRLRINDVKETFSSRPR